MENNANQSSFEKAYLKWIDCRVSWDGQTAREFGHVDNVILSSGTIFLTVTPEDWGHQHTFFEEDVELEPSNAAK